VLDDVVAVDAQVCERIVAMSAAEQVRVVGGRQATAARPVGRHRLVRPRRAHVRELMVETLRTLVDPVVSCTHSQNSGTRTARPKRSLAASMTSGPVGGVA